MGGGVGCGKSGLEGASGAKCGASCVAVVTANTSVLGGRAAGVTQQR